jgi:hypothetical protein
MLDAHRHKKCRIGDVGQFHTFIGSSPKEIRSEPWHYAHATGRDGEYSRSASDQFFDVDMEL